MLPCGTVCTARHIWLSIMSCVATKRFGAFAMARADPSLQPASELKLPIRRLESSSWSRCGDWGNRGQRARLRTCHARPSTIRAPSPCSSPRWAVVGRRRHLSILINPKEVIAPPQPSAAMSYRNRNISAEVAMSPAKS